MLTHLGMKPLIGCFAVCMIKWEMLMYYLKFLNVLKEL